MKPFDLERVKVQNMKEKSKIHGFRTPDDYLESVEKELLNRIDESDFPRHHGLATPEKYFDNLEDRYRLLLYKDNSDGKTISINEKNWMPFISGIAACLVAGLFIWNQLSDPSILLADTEISSYIENGAISVESVDLAQLLSEEDLDALTLEASFFTNENLEDYLIEHLEESNLYQE